MTTFTAPATFHLATLEGITYGLGWLGATWKPKPFNVAAPPQTNGLYAWATDDRAIIYLGIGVSSGGSGLVKRITFEEGAATAEYIHGHALAITRLRARGINVQAYAGDIGIVDDFDASWIRDADWAETHKAHTRQVIADLKDDRYRQAEKFAIRLSMHLGDIGSPVNSQHKGAWAFSKTSAVGPTDAAAEMVAARMVGRLKPETA